MKLKLFVLALVCLSTAKSENQQLYQFLQEPSLFKKPHERAKSIAEDYTQKNGLNGFEPIGIKELDYQSKDWKVFDVMLYKDSDYYIVKVCVNLKNSKEDLVIQKDQQCPDKSLNFQQLRDLVSKFASDMQAQIDQLEESYK